MEWTHEAITRLRGLWSEGHSTAEIGRRMGVSKNAIVGKAHRLELPGRPSPIRHEPARQRRHRALAHRITGPTLPSLAACPVVPPNCVLPATAERLPRPARAEGAGEDGTAGDGLRSAGLRRTSPPPGSDPGTIRGSAGSGPRDADQTGSRGIGRDPAAADQGRGWEPGAPRPGRRQVTCCWPIGEPGTSGFRFCDAVALSGKPYCEPHAQLAYVRVRDRREDAA